MDGGTRSYAGGPISRRRLITGAAIGGVALCAHRWHIARPAFAQTAAGPVPIPNTGVGPPPGTHFFLPNPGDEPSLIYNFNGLIALAHYQSPATDNAGNTLILESDCRAMAGEYIASDGSRKRGAFAFI
ncbi:MAG TPA: hypothetical protein VKV26_09970 [Dehalococcoidia bacterium]|nr:hypothetical protein [Dehalococcoidia bacterium]